jgi:hypothetical protein
MRGRVYPTLHSFSHLTSCVGVCVLQEGVVIKKEGLVTRKEGLVTLQKP